MMMKKVYWRALKFRKVLNKTNERTGTQETKYSHRKYHTNHNLDLRWLCFSVYHTHKHSLFQFIASFFPFAFMCFFFSVDNFVFNILFVIVVCLLHLFFPIAFHDEYIKTRWSKISQQWKQAAVPPDVHTHPNNLLWAINGAHELQKCFQPDK